MPVDIKTVIRAMRTQMATDAANDDIPAFDRQSSEGAQAHVDYLMNLRAGDTRLPSFEVETVTIYKLKVNPPTT